MEKNTGIHPEDLKAAIRKQYGSLLAFEAAHNLGKRGVTDHIKGKTSRRTAEAIAIALKSSVHVLFPGRYKSTPADDSAATRSAHRLNRKAIQA